MGAAKNTDFGASTAERYAAASLVAVNNHMTPEKSRHLFLAVTALTASARDAEHYAYMLMAELECKTGKASVEDFRNFTIERLREVREQLKFVGTLINENQG